jgi:hypothetical protein
VETYASFKGSDLSNLIMTAAVNHRKNLYTLCLEVFGAPPMREDLSALMRELCFLPDFLNDFIFNYYYLDLSDTETATTLNISESLVRQRIQVSTTLINILYASKPKNPV